MQICQDDTAREKTLQLMASMTSAQIVSAGGAIHNKMSPVLEGPLALHASTPVSYPAAVSSKNTRHPQVYFIFFSSFIFVTFSASGEMLTLVDIFFSNPSSNSVACLLRILLRF